MPNNTEMEIDQVNLVKAAIELERLALSPEAKRMTATVFSTELAKACAKAWGLKMEIECRKAFEDKAKANYDLARREDGHYSNRDTECCWKGWQSAWDYAGGQPERLPEAPSDVSSCAPDRQGEALIAEPPAPATEQPVELGKLLPCPFCGGEANIDDSSRHHTVYCTKCGALPDDDNGANFDRTRAQAIKYWNRRVPMREVQQPDEKRIAYHESSFDEMRDIFLLESLRCAGLNICEPELWMGICRSAMKRLSEREPQQPDELAWHENMTPEERISYWSTECVKAKAALAKLQIEVEMERRSTKRESRVDGDIKLLACAALGISPDSHVQTKEEYAAEEKLIMEVARHYLAPDQYPLPEEQGRRDAVTPEELQEAVRQAFWKHGMNG